MVHGISDACVSCGSYAGERPADVTSQGDTQHVIDEFGCIDCDACEAVCPAGAVSETN